MKKLPDSLKSRARLAASEVMFERLLHDLKQPLNVVRIVAQELRLDCVKNRLEVESIPDNMREIEQSVDILVGQIDQLRAFVGIGAEHQISSGVDLVRVCEAAASRVLEAYPNVEIAKNFAQQMNAVKCESFILEQALFEMLDNGAQSTLEAGVEVPRVTISMSNRDNGVSVYVEDNGIGIPEKLRSKIFDPFFTTRAGASGLGLALVAAAIKKAGGRIVFPSEQAVGARIEIWLPGEE